MTEPDRERSVTAAERTGSLLERLPPQMRAITARLGDAFAQHGAELYLVGGSVRDLLLGQPVTDLDFATSAEPELTKAAGAAAGADSVYTVGEQFGTVGFVFDGVSVEITTYREEHYPTPDRRPKVRLGTDLVGDLSRRDFTINAIAVDARDGTVHDPFGGLDDLERRIIRAVGDPKARFAEDPLRILRAARFAAQLDFRVDRRTLAAMRAMGPQLERISRERIAAELNRLLIAPAAARGLALLHETDLLRWVLPEVVPMAEDTGAGRHKDIWLHTLRVVEQSPPRLAVRWAALLHDAAKPMTRSVDARGEVHFFGHERVGADLARKALRRLKQERALIDRVAGLVEMHLRPASYDSTWTDSAVRRLMLEAGDLWDDLLDLAAADVTSARAHRQREAARRIAALREHARRLEEEHALAQLQSPLDGHELMAMFGRPPGRWIGEVKDHLRELVIDGVLAPDDKEGARAEALRWMAEHGDV
ncbi:CCA tRNA nucleotidyltransferase [Sphaerobacter thermophilus]|uniref:Polynucleotide adenylyltransferase/metal dependent phosphohydrolase n=1 Tax=Sphaerobacter thermophilus (strain ATCC 49802 / DSM 20745 / KCCM 41009 / NCIMB 13125 / S 6022) TaxID=479434 RepID=D1C7Z9_SPHTD|nr:HD domain-containing protein [Sphaerobacter thermophilus]ACZ39870.1 polynucleotide adenylyltransferase/metal dependent phosphohydrolase [Sphaerobacter thermophilus DSM 20745]